VTTEITFAELMAARWGPLYRTAYLLAGDRHDAEDLLQSALARTCVRWDGIRDKGAADAYVWSGPVEGCSEVLVRSRGRRPPTSDNTVTHTTFGKVPP